MHRHFLSYRKRRHDAENHVHICALRHSGESLQNGQQPQGNRLGKNPSSNHQRMKLRRHCQQLGLCLFPPCYFIFLEPCQVRGVSVFFALFTLVFIICKNDKVLFVLVQQTSDFVASLGQGLGLGQLPVLAIPWCFCFLFFVFFSWFALLFLELHRSFIYDVRVRGVVWRFNETSHSFFVWGSS